MSTTLLEIFEQARHTLRVEQERLRLNRQTYNSYQRQAMAAGMPAPEREQYCAQALTRIGQSITVVADAEAQVEAAYATIPEADRPTDYWS